MLPLPGLLYGGLLYVSLPYTEELRQNILYEAFPAAAVCSSLLPPFLAPLRLIRRDDKAAAMPAQTKRASCIPIQGMVQQNQGAATLTEGADFWQSPGVARLVTCTQCRPAAMCHDSSR